jgi:uncharacterized membrane protein YdbT with pleckstrin-like domain
MYNPLLDFTPSGGDEGARKPEEAPVPKYHQLIIRSGPSTENEGVPAPHRFLQRFKAAIMAIVILGAAVGVLLAVLLLGSVFAALTIIMVVLAVAVWTARGLWQRRVRRM